MKKLIGRLLAIVLIAALAVCGIVTYNGYRLYKEVTEAVPVSEKVAEIEEQAHYTTYESLPKRYVEAVIAAEDRRFFRHHGFDILATGRAMWHNIEAGRLIEGGSTITQQLAKNMYFSQEKKFTRKVAEVFVAQELEDLCDKKTLFELYVNSIYFGSGYYNIYLRYFSINEDGVSKKTSIERSIYIDGAIPFYESTYVSISKTYRSYVEDGEGNKLYGSNIQNGDDRGFATDINGNEIRPSAEMTEAWRTIALMDSTGSHVEPLKFYLSEGEHVLQFFARREPMVLSAIRLEPVSEVQSYEDYLKKYSGKTNVTAEDIGTESGYIKIEAEYPDAVSDNTIYATNDRTSQATSPQHPSIQYLNTLGGAGSGDQKKWSTVGQWVRYRVVVPCRGPMCPGSCACS